MQGLTAKRHKGIFWSHKHVLYLDCSGGCACVLSRFSHVWLFVTLWTVARQAPLPKGFSRQEYWQGLPCPLPGDLSNLGIKPMFLMSPARAGRFFTTSTTWEAPWWLHGLNTSNVHLKNNQSIVNLQCFVSFKCRAKWFEPAQIFKIPHDLVLPCLFTVSSYQSHINHLFNNLASLPSSWLSYL